MRKWLIATACIALPLIVGFTSGYLSGSGAGNPWYQNLDKPSFNPPSWVFGPVWTTLYVLMGVSLFLIYDTPRSAMRRWGLILFGVQLVLNFFWSLIFFRFEMLAAASAEILLLLASIVAMILVFYRVRPVAAYLQIPYLLWVSFASVLTITIYWMNRG